MTHLADVATLQRLPDGAAFPVRHVVGHPGVARLAGPADGLDRGAGLVGLAVVVAAA